MLVTRVMLLVAAGAMLAGCVSGRAKDTQAYRDSVMHSGTYRLGYNDGCEVANYTWQRQQQARDKATYDKEPDYREGWLAGTLNCKDVVFIVNSGKPNDHISGLF